MKISCPACAAKYSIADEKVQDRLAKIRCRKCGVTIVIDGKVTPPSVTAGDGGSSPAAAARASAPAGGEYSVDFGDNDQRTLPLAAIVAAYHAGQVTAETFVWADGMDDWKPITDVPEIVAALHSASSPRAAAAPAQDLFAAPAAVEMPRPAARSGGRGSTADLFGSVASAGSEEDVATSAADGSPAAATGARNESSVLFSLSALTKAEPKKSAPVTSTPSYSAAAASAASSSSSSSSAREDSGLIDLKALTAAKPEESQDLGFGGGSFGLGGGGLGLGAPLGMASPLGGPAVDAHANQQQKQSKTGMYIAIAVAVAAVAGLGIMVVTKKEPPPATTQIVTVMAPAPTAPTPAPTINAAPPPTGTSAGDEKKDDDGKPKAASTKRSSGGGSGGSSKTPPATKTAEPAPGGSPAPAPKAKKNPCGCANGDLQCAMRCAAQ